MKVCVCVVEVVMGGSGGQIDGNRMFHEMARQTDTQMRTRHRQNPCRVMQIHNKRSELACIVVLFLTFYHRRDGNVTPKMPHTWARMCCPVHESLFGDACSVLFGHAHCAATFVCKIFVSRANLVSSCTKSEQACHLWCFAAENLRCDGNTSAVLMLLSLGASVTDIISLGLRCDSLWEIHLAAHNRKKKEFFVSITRKDLRCQGIWYDLWPSCKSLFSSSVLMPVFFPPGRCALPFLKLKRQKKAWHGSK